MTPAPFFDSERRLARRQQDRDLADFFVNATIGLKWVGPDGIILWANQYQLDLLGRPASEVIGRHISEFYSEKDVINEILQRLRQQVSVGDHELELKTKDGQIKNVQVSSNAFWEHGRFIHARFFIRDITDRKTAEEIIRRQREELKLITDTVPALMAFIDKDQRYRFNNDTYRKWFGEVPKQVYGRTVREVIGDRSYQRIQPYLERALKGEQVFYETTVTRKNGQKRHVSGVYTPRFDNNGNVQGVVSIVNDITERQEAEQKILESERRFHALADAAPVMIWTAQADGARDYFNISWLEFTGKTLQECLKWGWMDLIHPDDRESFLETYKKSIQERQPYKTEYRLRRHDGQYRWMFSQGVPRLTSDSGLFGYIGTLVDIHHRKQYEEKMQLFAEASKILFSSLDYETTLNNLARLLVPRFTDGCLINLLENNQVKPVALVHHDPQKLARLQEFNKKYAPGHGSLGAATVMRSGTAELYTTVSEKMLERLAQEPEHLEALKELGMVSLITVPLKIQNNIFGSISFIQTESGNRYTEDDLLFAEELARSAATAIDNAMLYQKLRDSDNAKTHFLSMLAHELRNPMAPILSSIQLLESQSHQQNQEAKETIHLMERQIRQMSRLLDDLLDVSRIIHGKIQLSKKEVDLNTVAAYAIETTRPLKEEFQHTLSVSLPSRPVPLVADPVRIEQIIVNLLNNAYKYTEPHGTVWLTINHQNEEVVIRVKDTGIGIAPQMLSKIFDLFSQVDRTLSRSYGGMGIGLTLVKGLVEMHDGTISVESAGLGKGSEFIVRLPAAKTVFQDPQANFNFGRPQSISTPNVKPPQKILVVDDNRDAAHALGKLLEHLGHEIAYAYDGTSALQKAHEYQPGVILLDIGLPEVNGYEVARQLRKDSLFKGTLLVAVSGYGQEEDRLRSQEAGFDYHFTKPIGIDRLTEIL